MAKILVVEDYGFICQLVAHSLQTKRHHVETASDGSTALRLAQEQEFDLVLTDLYVPKLDGISLTRELRQLPAYNNIPIVILSVEMNQDKILEGLDAGVTEWFIKPFTPDKLVEKVDQLLTSQEETLETPAETPVETQESPEVAVVAEFDLEEAAELSVDPAKGMDPQTRMPNAIFCTIMGIDGVERTGRFVFQSIA